MLEQLNELRTKITALFATIKSQLANKLDKNASAASANKLTTPFTLQLSNDVSGQANIDGSGNVSINVSLISRGLTAGMYGSPLKVPQVTVNSQGVITAISMVDPQDGTTAQKGVVQLSTATNSASAATAATSGAVKAAYDLAASKLDATANAVSSAKLSTARSIALSGDATWSVNFDGTANVTGALTLSNSGVTAGSYGKVTVDVKGRVTAGAALLETDIPALSIAKTTGLQAALDAKLGAAAQAVSAAKLATVRSLAASGDATWSVNFDGTANVSSVITLAASGITAGSYAVVTIDAKGRATAGRALAIGDIPTLDIAKTAGLQAALDSKMTSLGYTPVQMGTGTNQLANVVKIGWLAGSQLGLVIDATNFANNWPINITGSSASLTTARNIAITGDGTWNVNFTGAGNVTGVFTLSNSGVAVGTYSKVTVNAKGQVTAGAALVAADIPALDTSKLSTGVLPTARGGTGGNYNMGSRNVFMSTAAPDNATGADGDIWLQYT